MFELREKFEKNNFLAILTPQNCNLVGPRRPSGQFSEIRVPTQWNPNFGIVVHCIYHSIAMQNLWFYQGRTINLEFQNYGSSLLVQLLNQLQCTVTKAGNTKNKNKSDNSP